MSQLTMPLLVVNLGAEMVYILEQRLKAQNIPADKSCKVLHDVVRTMFDASYVDKLFAPQDMYTVAQTRKIFDRLAHSSIMRLSESRCGNPARGQGRAAGVAGARGGGGRGGGRWSPQPTQVPCYAC